MHSPRRKDPLYHGRLPCLSSLSITILDVALGNGGFPTADCDPGSVTAAAFRAQLRAVPPRARGRTAVRAHAMRETTPFPRDETRRLAAVRRYDILDTQVDGSIDRITAVAARRFGVPISVISIVDHDRIWFKSHQGTQVREVERESGLCFRDPLWRHVHRRRRPARPSDACELFGRRWTGLRRLRCCPVDDGRGLQSGAPLRHGRAPESVRPRLGLPRRLQRRVLCRPRNEGAEGSGGQLAASSGWRPTRPAGALASQW